MFSDALFEQDRRLRKGQRQLFPISQRFGAPRRRLTKRGKNDFIVEPFIRKDSEDPLGSRGVVERDALADELPSGARIIAELRAREIDARLSAAIDGGNERGA